MGAVKRRGTALALAVLTTLALAGCGQTNIPSSDHRVYAPGGWEDDVYTSEFLGLRYTLPQGWTHSTGEELAAMAEENGQPPTEKQRGGDYSDATVIYEMAVQSEKGDGFFTLMVSNRSNAGDFTSTEEDIFRVFVEGIKSVYGEGGVEAGEAFDLPVGGKTFRVLPVSYSSGFLTQWNALCFDGNFLYNISLMVIGQDLTPQDLLDPFEALPS